MLICEKAFVKNKKIMCEVSGMSCAHVRFCQLTGKYRQTDNAKKCPGRGTYENIGGDTVHGNDPHAVF